MSVTSALASALTGLSAASRAADTVSDNIANAMTEGFARREVELASRGVGGGVQVVGVERAVDPVALHDRRAYGAQRAHSETRIGFMEAASRAIGVPGDGYGLPDLVAELEADLAAAAAQPESQPSLARAVDTAGALADRFRSASEAVQTERQRADAAIASGVKALNADLARVAELNSDIRRATNAGRSSNALLDARQLAVDRISELVPVREVARGGGVISLLSEGGLLLEGTPVSLGFTASQVVEPESTLSDGSLSAVTVNGVAVDMSRSKHVLSGGKLQALFDVRDVDGPAAQSDLDALARDIIARFEASDADPAGAGLLTDAGVAYASGSETGLAARLAVNALADPEAGGAVWRLRDGLSAASPGEPGDATRLKRHREALTDRAEPASSVLDVAARDATGLAADVVSRLGLAREDAETRLVFATARETALSDALAAEGVDTDNEMQSLLLIERAYAANARVVSTAGRMIDTLLEI